ncbi:MAG TPA: AIM24 family protein, partial [Vicinamibacterales bacterium]|nr:AIM24 family protein [Vicinamibacterales bacterium]
MTQQQWYMAIGGHQVGPVSQDDVITNLRNGTIDGNTLVFTAGMTNWTPLKEVSQFAPYLGATGGRPGTPPVAPPPPIQGRVAHEIDFRIVGTEMQFVEVELDPGESAVAEAGSMMYMKPGIQMETVFGDGSQQRTGGVMGALLGAGKRLLTGESLFMTIFTNQGAGKQQVAFAAPYPGKILAMDLKQIGGELICQKDAFLCAARGVSIGIAFQKKLGVGLFGGEGFIMERLQGDGLCFMHAGGTVVPIDLAAGETLRIDTGCLVALQPTVNYDIQFVGGIKTALFGGEGLFF